MSPGAYPKASEDEQQFHGGQMKQRQRKYAPVVNVEEAIRRNSSPN
jgi:hypothetical protein